MTVAELIRELQKYDGDIKVEIQYRSREGYTQETEPARSPSLIQNSYTGRKFVLL